MKDKRDSPGQAALLRTSLFPALLAVLLASAAAAQEGKPDLAEEVGKRSDAFATIAGGWWLERRCGFLEEDEARAFETLTAEITGAMRLAYGIDWTHRLQRAAKAATETVPCSESARALVQATSQMAVELNRDLGGEDYDPETSYRRYLEERLFGIAAALGLAERCGYGPEAARQDFATLFRRLGDRLARDWQSPGLTGSLESARRKVEEAGTPACSDRNHMAVLSSLQDARVLGVQFGLWSQEGGLVD